LEWKVFVHWVRLLLKASVLNSPKLQDAAVMDSDVVKELEARLGRAEAREVKRKRSNGVGN
jgi:hypothetical protein